MMDAFTLGDGGPPDAGGRPCTDPRHPGRRPNRKPRPVRTGQAADGRDTFDIATQKYGRPPLIEARQAGAARQAHSGLRRPRFRPPPVLG